MKRGVYLVNTARGALINDDDLIQALDDGHIAGAALDVFTDEPLSQAHPLINRHDVILTGHTAGNSQESLLAMGMASAHNVWAALSGDELDPRNIVNPEVLSD